MCRDLEDFPKVVLAVYAGSSLITRIGTLAYYRMGYEVLMPVYTRTGCWLSQGMSVNVELPRVPEFIDYRT